MWYEALEGEKNLKKHKDKYITSDYSDQMIYYFTPAMASISSYPGNNDHKTNNNRNNNNTNK
jgi:hypothetical protein